MGEKQSLADAVASGDRLQGLQRLADGLAARFESADSDTAAASLARQLALVLEQIAELKPPESKGTPLDELAKRRADRPAGPARRVRAGS